MNKFLGLLAFFVIFGATGELNAAEKFANHNPDIQLEDYLKVEGTYEIKTSYHFIDANNLPRSEPFPTLDLFILLYDAGKNKLVGALSSKVTYTPLVLFEDLKTEYNSDRTAIVLRGLGGGVVHGEIRLELGIDSGAIQGRLTDGIAVGRKHIEGKRISSLHSFLESGEALRSLRERNAGYAFEDITGLYEGAQKGGPGCAPGANCPFRILMRRFSDGTITATISFRSVHGGSGENDFGVVIPYVGGTYDKDFQLIEFTSGGRSSNPKLRSKVNVKILPDKKLCIYIYGTNGNYAYFKAKWTRPVLD